MWIIKLIDKINKINVKNTWFSSKNIKIEPNNLSKKLENSIYNTKEVKLDRLYGKKYSINEINSINK